MLKTFVSARSDNYQVSSGSDGENKRRRLRHRSHHLNEKDNRDAHERQEGEAVSNLYRDIIGRGMETSIRVWSGLCVRNVKNWMRSEGWSVYVL